MARRRAAGWILWGRAVPHQGRSPAGPLGLALFAALAACGSEPAPPTGELAPEPPARVLVALFDGLGAGRVSHLGAERPTTPALDALAEEGTTFVNAHAPSSDPEAARASLLTGRAGGGEVDLAPTLRAERSFVELGPGPGGLPEGLPDGDPAAPPEDPDRLARRAAQGLAGPAPAAVLLWFAEPRLSAPGHADAARWAPGRSAEELAALDASALGEGVPFAEREALRALFDARARRADDALGRLVEELRAAGVYDETLVVVAAAGGTALWEHGRRGGADQVHAETLHVPFVVKPPRAWGLAPRRSDALVTTLDLLPSLRDWLGLPALEGSEGRSVTPLLRGDERAFRGRSFIVRSAGDPPALALVTDLRKSILVRDPADRPLRVDAYDLDLDPAEQRPMGARQLPEAAHDFTRLSSFERRRDARQRGLNVSDREGQVEPLGGGDVRGEEEP